MEIFICWMVLSIAAGLFAEVRRNRSGVGWFILALIISPLLAGIFVAILKELPSKKNIQNYIENEMADGRMLANVLRGSGTTTPHRETTTGELMFGPAVIILAAMIIMFLCAIISRSTL